MDFETAAFAAARLGVTTRAIQKWAKEGKLPGAYKQGRDWLIPVTATRPGEQQVSVEESSLKYFLPLTAGGFDVSDTLGYINSLQDDLQRKLALAEYHYYRGDTKDCLKLAKPYLSSKDDTVFFTAALLTGFAALATGKSEKTSALIEQILRRMHSVMRENDDIHLQAVAVLSAKVIYTQLQIETGEMPLLRRYIRHLPDGLKLFAAYALAYESFLQNNYDRALGILEGAIACADADYPYALLNSYSLSAVCHMHLNHPEQAVYFVTRAWNIAKHDLIIAPFAEHYGLLQGVVEAAFKRTDPEAFEQICKLANTYSVGWYELYNEKTHHEVVTSLRGVEKPIAILYSRGWRIKEIASFLNVSENTIKKHIQVIYEKLHINGKKDLAKHLFL